MPSSQYFIRNANEIHFLTLTVVEWVDVFTRSDYKLIIVESLKYCQQHKGLTIYAWCLMSNHLHLVARAQEGFRLSDVLRDFKKFTSKKIVKAIQEINESRKDWLLYRFAFAGKFHPNVENYKFWQDGNQAKECYSREFIRQKINYVHENPVRALWVELAEEYLFSSARDYAGKTGLLKIDFYN